MVPSYLTGVRASPCLGTSHRLALLTFFCHYSRTANRTRSNYPNKHSRDGHAGVPVCESKWRPIMNIQTLTQKLRIALKNHLSKRNVQAQPEIHIVYPQPDELRKCEHDDLFGPNGFLIGGGKENYQFMPTEKIVANCLAAIEENGIECQEIRITGSGRSEIDFGSLLPLTNNDTRAKTVRFVKLPADAPVTADSDERKIGTDWAEVMIGDMFKEPVHSLFASTYKPLGRGTKHLH